MIRVMIADDHTMMRDGLRQILEETSDISVVDEARDGPETIRKVRQNDYDVVVLDIAMPGGDGLNVLRAVKQEKPSQPVLILSMYTEDQFAVRLLRAGAAGYLTKASAAEDLVTAIRRVFLGGTYVTPALAEKLASGLAWSPDRPPHELLSDREYEVLRLFAAGKSVGEIAAELSLSVKTVSTYRTRLLAKLRLKNNAELIRYAVTQALT